MKPAEVRERLGKKWRERRDGNPRRLPRFTEAPVEPATARAWPTLPARDSAPAELREALRRDAAEILGGRWRAFGHLVMEVGHPPRWDRDPIAGRDHPTARPGFRLNHRELPKGSDIKLVWELSRWSHLTRLAQAGWVAGEMPPLQGCVECLQDWCRRNPPYLGWNWTSALEAGMRLLNFAWMDALLGAAGVEAATLESLRRQVLPAHVWYTWRHRSVGSSANNHLLGELAGLIAATARWPGLERWGTRLGDLARLWEGEVLAQFADDGGNREQALNYQLFAWELCWHARGALRAAGIGISEVVEDRLRRAADFFVTVQVPGETWDYGDSDSATGVPLFASEADAVGEWHRWLGEPATSPALHWWLGEPPAPVNPPACRTAASDWLVFPETGQAVAWTGDWQARWDLSPLGYLSTAAHGHLDALHVTLWLSGVALVIDPGTGAYYGDTRLRAWLASWPAHNGPHVPGADFPRRLGPFLWGAAHARPEWREVDGHTLEGRLTLPQGQVERRVRRVLNADQDGWEIEDRFTAATAEAGRWFRVHWQFAPGTRLEVAPGNPRFFHGERRGVRFTVGLDAAWTRVEQVLETHGSLGFPVTGDLRGLCSPAFRRLDSGPLLELVGREGGATLYRTTIRRV